MKLVMTLVVRDEADIVEQQLHYHLERGVDFVIATDHRSGDGTTEILRRHEREGHLRLIRENDARFRQSEWVTRMARLAATDHGADWVLNSDADEFWWPREGTLKEILTVTPPRFGVVRGLWRNFVLRPDDERPFYERMTIRRAPDVDPASPYHAQVKVLHRASPEVVVPRGNHDALGRGLALIREWFPVEILHFPIRSGAQLRRKFGAAEAYRAGPDSRLPRHTAAVAARLDTEEEDLESGFAVDDEALEHGLVAGELSLDTRLRDALQGQKALPPALADDACYAAEIDLLLGTDSARRLPGRVRLLERRLEALERRRRARPRLTGS